MLRHGGSPEAGSQVGLLQGLRNSRAVVVGTFAGMAIFASSHGAEPAAALPTGVGYGDVPEQIDDFIKDASLPAPLGEDYPYDKVNLDSSDKDKVRFYQGCMYGADGRVKRDSVAVSRLAGSNIIDASVVLADECREYSMWRVFATTEYKRGNMTKYAESKTTVPAYTSADDIASDVEYGKEYPMTFFPFDSTCQQDPTIKYRVKVVSVRYSRFVDKKYEQETSSNVISC